MRMLTFTIIYLICYLCANIYILKYLHSILMLKNVSAYSLPFIVTFIRKYEIISPLFFLFFLLSGLPPVCFFFIKLNFAVTIMAGISIVFLVIIIGSLILSSLFYLQIFNISSIDQKYSREFINNLKHNTFSKKQSKSYNDKLYRDTRNMFLFFFLMFFSLFFWCDMYLCVNVFKIF